MKGIKRSWNNLYAKSKFVAILLLAFLVIIGFYSSVFLVAILAFVAPLAILFYLILRGLKGSVDDYCEEENDE